MPVDVQYLTQRKPLTLLVVAQEGPPLLGRNWLEHWKLDWKNIATVYSNQETSLSLEKVLSSNGDIFADKLGTMEPFRAKLHVKAGARPKLCKARTVPYIVKDVIDQELDCLEFTGIIESVSYSDWACQL